MSPIRINPPSWNLRNLICSILVCAAVSGCNSPEAQRKEREATLTSFVTGVVRHLLDKNPATVQESMSTLTRTGGELTEQATAKLDKEDLIPDSDIAVLKMIAQAQAKHTSNEVIVQSVKPLNPITDPEVKFKVTGKEVLKVNNKPTDDRVFELFVTTKLTPDMGDYPRVTDISGLPSTTTADGDKKPAVKRKPKR